MNTRQIDLQLSDTAYPTIKKTAFEGMFVIERPVFPDNRGLFHELYQKKELEEVLGYSFAVVQANHARSNPGVIRALHAEKWNKLVYPVNGEMTSFYVDIRPDSETFGTYLRVDFTDEHKYVVFVPNGVANSICVTGNTPVEYIYLIDAYYTGKDTTAITWDDPDLNIEWPITNPVISDRDRNNPTLREMFPEKFL